MPKMKLTIEQLILRDLDKYINDLISKAIICRHNANKLKNSGFLDLAEKEFEMARKLDSAAHKLEELKKEIHEIFRSKEEISRE